MKICTYYIVVFLVILVFYSNSASSSDWAALKETKPDWYFKINKYLISSNPYNLINFDIWWEKTKNKNNYVRVQVYPFVKGKSTAYFIEDYSTHRCSIIYKTQQQIRDEMENPNSFKFMIFFVNINENENPMHSRNIELTSSYNEQLGGDYKGKFSDLGYKATITYHNGNIYKCNNGKWLKNNQIDSKDYSSIDYQSTHSLILFCQKQESSTYKKIALSLPEEYEEYDINSSKIYLEDRHCIQPDTNDLKYDLVVSKAAATQSIKLEYKQKYENCPACLNINNKNYYILLDSNKKQIDINEFRVNYCPNKREQICNKIIISFKYQGVYNNRNFLPSDIDNNIDNFIVNKNKIEIKYELKGEKIIIEEERIDIFNDSITYKVDDNKYELLRTIYKEIKDGTMMVTCFIGKKRSVKINFECDGKTAKIDDFLYCTKTIDTNEICDKKGIDGKIFLAKNENSFKIHSIKSDNYLLQNQTYKIFNKKQLLSKNQLIHKVSLKKSTKKDKTIKFEFSDKKGISVIVKKIIVTYRKNNNEKGISRQFTQNKDSYSIGIPHDQNQLNIRIEKSDDYQEYKKDWFNIPKDNSIKIELEPTPKKLLLKIVDKKTNHPISKADLQILIDEKAYSFAAPADSDPGTFEIVYLQFYNRDFNVTVKKSGFKEEKRNEKLLINKISTPLLFNLTKIKTIKPKTTKDPNELKRTEKQEPPSKTFKVQLYYNLNDEKQIYKKGEVIISYKKDSNLKMQYLKKDNIHKCTIDYNQSFPPTVAIESKSIFFHDRKDVILNTDKKIQQIELYFKKPIIFIYYNPNARLFLNMHNNPFPKFHTKLSNFSKQLFFGKQWKFQWSYGYFMYQFFNQSPTILAELDLVNPAFDKNAIEKKLNKIELVKKGTHMSYENVIESVSSISKKFSFREGDTKSILVYILGAPVYPPDNAQLEKLNNLLAQNNIKAIIAQFSNGDLERKVYTDKLSITEETVNKLEVNNFKFWSSMIDQIKAKQKEGPFFEEEFIFQLKDINSSLPAPNIEEVIKYCKKQHPFKNLRFIEMNSERELESYEFSEAFQFLSDKLTLFKTK